MPGRATHENLIVIWNRHGGDGARFGPWYGFDDSHTDGPLAPGEAQTRAAYLLFYRRRQDAAQDHCAPEALLRCCTHLLRQNLP